MGRHTIFEMHRIPHKVSLKVKLLLLFYLLLIKWDIAFGSSCGVGHSASGMLRYVKVAEVGCEERPLLRDFAEGPMRWI